MRIRTKHLAGMLVVLIIVLGAASLWTFIRERFSGVALTPALSPASPLNLKTDAAGNIIAPEVTPTMQKVLDESTGFQVLVSYTDRGFEPRTLSIKKGETVRFTNNSVRDLWVATVGSPYPPTGENCGSSAFDSCTTLKPLEFWEFTFTEKGDWTYVDNLHKEFMGTVHVR